jgi:hypothetical protein
MTLPFERTRAVNNTREFLFSLLDPKQTPRISSAIREQARSLLRHYPTPLDMDSACSESNKIFRINFNEDRY